MDDALRLETEGLVRSWARHEAGFLQDYLVASVEDPRLNFQSILSRHFLLSALQGERFARLMEQELLFAAAMAWLTGVDKADADQTSAVLHALRSGADNAEGRVLPGFLVRLFSSLPTTVDGVTVPNYVEEALTQPRSDVTRGAGDQGPALPAPSSVEGSGVEGSGIRSQESGARPACPEQRRGERSRRVRGQGSEQTFERLWAAVLAPLVPAEPKPVVIEAACGSANDYRFLQSYGLSSLLEYRGFDLAEKNIANARALFPQACFEVGNIFALHGADQSCDYFLAQDLFEHLSLHGLETALGEACRITRRALCLGFFSMDEIREHQVRPVEDYHWNTLSMERVRESLQAHQFETRVIHIDTYLRWLMPGQSTHNPNAYTLVATRKTPNSP